jgi:hypothetical protein
MHLEFSPVNVAWSAKTPFSLQMSNQLLILGDDVTFLHLQEQQSIACWVLTFLLFCIPYAPTYLVFVQHCLLFSYSLCDIFLIKQNTPHFFLSFFFCGTGAWTRALYLEPLHQPYLVLIFFIFQDKVLWTICSGQASNHDPFDLCHLNN